MNINRLNVQTFSNANTA